MKKFLFSYLAFTVLYCSNVIGQTFTTQLHAVGDTAFKSWSTPGDMELHNAITNVSPNSITINWKVISSHFDAGWTFGGFCDNLACWGDSTVLGGSSRNYAPMAPNETADCKALLNADAAAGNTYAVVVVKLTDPDAAFTKTVTFLGVKWNSGVTQIQRIDGNVVIFPNPANGDYVNVHYDANSGVKNIAMYNVIGKMVAIYKTTNKESAKLEGLSKYPGGVYYLRLLDKDGRLISTRKFTKQ